MANAIGAVTFRASADPELAGAKFDNAAAAGDTVAVAGAAGQVIRVYRLFLVAAAATSITFKDGATALTGAMSLAANEAMILDFDGEPWFTCSNAANFVVNSANAVQVSGRVYYTQG